MQITKLANQLSNVTITDIDKKRYNFLARFQNRYNKIEDEEYVLPDMNTRCNASALYDRYR